LKVLFAYLSAFSTVGGIQKFNRSFLKALHELSIDGCIDAEAISSHDTKTNEKYFSSYRFKGYGGNRVLFFIIVICKAIRYNTIVIGHINLALIACIIKRIFPQKKIILIVHGIDVWHELKGFQKEIVTTADIILAVSDFTKQKLLMHNPKIQAEKIKIFRNTIDPWFSLPQQFNKPEYLLQRYQLNQQHKVMLTVTRLADSEKYKGYDILIEMMAVLSKQNKNMIYLIGGKADEIEKERVQQLIKKYKVEDNVRLLGYIEDNELNDHYLLSDVFVMPSRKEGFGIVFIEAMACGRNVIAGNVDGSAEALLNGELGVLVNPDNTAEIKVAIETSIATTKFNAVKLQKKVVEAFGFKIYKENLKNILTKIN
jgi:glycosyltransferase involved in cell wall biosynthesis